MKLDVIADAGKCQQNIEKRYAYVYVKKLLRDLSGAKLDRCQLVLATGIMFTLHLYFEKRCDHFWMVGLGRNVNNFLKISQKFSKFL